MHHNWGDKDSQGRDICSRVEDVSMFIGEWLRKWPRVSVMQYKEKYGTVRIYCHFGWETFYNIWRPHYYWVSAWWPYKLDLMISHYIMPILNKIIIPIQIKMYRYRYIKAVEKWPDLKDEILCCTDWPEYLKGV
jgi:hypothetical protein